MAFKEINPTRPEEHLFEDEHAPNRGTFDQLRQFNIQNLMSKAKQVGKILIGVILLIFGAWASGTYFGSLMGHFTGFAAWLFYQMQFGHILIAIGAILIYDGYNGIARK